ncbi:MAG: hypothetical protein DSZ31_04020 [Gammaproteobacteria bacterium]|nr:MAG: hypothetical protein DSZ31_04020 [Gammaproteobacteria bacterium]
MVVAVAKPEIKPNPTVVKIAFLIILIGFIREKIICKKNFFYIHFADFHFLKAKGFGGVNLLPFGFT